MKIYETPKGVEQYINMCEGYDNSEFRSVILMNLDKGKKILELGVGPGNDYKWLSEDFKVTGSDYSKEFISRAQTRFPKGNFIELDALTMATNKKFNAIYSCKVLHHFELNQLETSLQKQHQVLEDSGLIIHSFWVGDRTEDIEDIHCVYFPSEKLIEVISKNYEVIYYKEYEEFEPKDSLFIIARKLN